MVKAGVNPEGVSPTQNPFNGNILFHPPELRGHVYCVMLNLMYQDWSFRPCHKAAILPRGTKKALFYHAKPRNGNHGDEA